MNVKRIKTFMLVVEHRSFSTVAQIQDMSQPAVSKQIQTLEKELGVPLLNRATLEPTEVGRRVYHKASSFMREWEELLLTCQAFQGELTGLLQIGASTIPGTYLIPQILRNFLAEYPRIEVQLSVHESDEVLDLVKEQKLDIGFIGRAPEDERFGSRLIATDRLVVIGPKDSESIDDFEEIKKAPFIFRSDRSGTWRAAKQGVQALGHSVDALKCVATVQNTESVLAMVEAGLGYGIVSEMAAKPGKESGRVKSLITLPVERDFYAVYLNSRAQQAALSSLIQFSSHNGEDSTATSSTPSPVIDS
ncbi:selenium metabolism-associated LysR family transcriptional regulator, partial [Caldalkalibacillus salinus]|uniref:selenium metabolism-associated LysR family transcriptional regulator n=1 Tax=Caldalkalibacillus salinus TaxID=2803787 RepID=UPI001924D055